MYSETIAVGYVDNAHGLAGELKVTPLTDDPRRFGALRKVAVREGSMGGDPSGDVPYKVLGAKLTGRFVALRLEGVATLGEARGLMGKYLYVDREDAVALPEGSHYVCDLIGCRVVDSARGELGTIADVMRTGSNDVYVVRKGRAEVLVPALKGVVGSIDVRGGVVSVTLPEGL